MSLFSPFLRVIKILDHESYTPIRNHGSHWLLYISRFPGRKIVLVSGSVKCSRPCVEWMFIVKCFAWFHQTFWIGEISNVLLQIDSSNSFLSKLVDIDVTLHITFAELVNCYIFIIDYSFPAHKWHLNYLFVVKYFSTE